MVEESVKDCKICEHPITGHNKNGCSIITCDCKDVPITIKNSPTEYDGNVWTKVIVKDLIYDHKMKVEHLQVAKGT